MTLTNFSTWLEDRCHTVHVLEKQAKQYIADNNMSAYRATMLEKAELLADLADDGEPLLATLPGASQSIAQAKLHRFSQSAAHAIELDSIFYMSALLFPEDYQEGQSNDLDLFLQKMTIQKS